MIWIIMRHQNNYKIIRTKIPNEFNFYRLSTYRLQKIIFDRL